MGNDENNQTSENNTRPAISITTSQNQNVKTGDVHDLVNFEVANPLVYIKTCGKE